LDAYGHSFLRVLAAWGRNGHRLVVNKAIETLPERLPQGFREFFEQTEAFLLQHVIDPLDAISKTPAERRNHFILLEKYGRFPLRLCPVTTSPR